MVHGYVSVILVTPVWTVPSNVTTLQTSVRMVSVTVDLVHGGVRPVKYQGAMGMMKTVLGMETVMVSQVYVCVTQDGLVLVVIYQTALGHQTVMTEACVCQRNQLQNVETVLITSLDLLVKLCVLMEALTLQNQATVPVIHAGTDQTVIIFVMVMVNVQKKEHADVALKASGDLTVKTRAALDCMIQTALVMAHVYLVTVSVMKDGLVLAVKYQIVLVNQTVTTMVLAVVTPYLYLAALTAFQDGWVKLVSYLVVQHMVDRTLQRKR